MGTSESLDRREDGLTAKLLDMYDRLQQNVITHMQEEGETVREIKEGLARVEAKVEEIMTAFPEGGAKHRLDHESLIDARKSSKQFWEKMKLVIATLVVGGLGTWITVIVWRAFLLGPK